jgi:hypothetical protein
MKGNTTRNARGTSFMEDRNAYLRKSRRRAWTLGRAGTMRRLAAALGTRWDDVCVVWPPRLGRAGTMRALSGRRAGTLPSSPRWELTGEEGIDTVRAVGKTGRGRGIAQWVEEELDLKCDTA